MENGKPTSENEEHVSEHDTILKKLKIDILLHLKEDKKIFHTISGPAGSGKTEIIKKLLTFLEDDKFKDKMDFVTVAAPTHSAVKNVMDRVQDIKIVYDHGTLHKLLSNGFDWETKKYRYKKSIIASLLIIDECSMIDDGMFGAISQISKSTPVIMLGDICQLPPVNNNHISNTFNEDLIEKAYYINKIHRTNSEDILELSEYFRQKILNQDFEKTVHEAYSNVVQYLFTKYNTTTDEDKDVISYISDNQYEFEKFYFSFIKDRFDDKENDENSAVIGCYTNNFVDTYNLMFRKEDPTLENKEDFISPGDLILITKTPFSEEFRIQNGSTIKITEDNLIKYDNFGEIEDLITPFTEDRVLKTINFKRGMTKIFREESKEYLKELIEVINTHLVAKGHPEIFILKNRVNNFVVCYPTEHDAIVGIIKNFFYNKTDYFNLEKKDQLKIDKKLSVFYDSILKYSYFYSSTIHKLQGRTIDNMYLDIRDFYRCKNVSEFYRLLYTAVTRAKHKISILI